MKKPQAVLSCTDALPAKPKPLVNGNYECSDFGNLKCSVFSNKSTSFSVTMMQQFR